MLIENTAIRSKERPVEEGLACGTATPTDVTMAGSDASASHGASRQGQYPCIHRSRSQDRLWSEASRFLIAVGEDEPVEKPRLVEEIVEEGDSSSDEEEVACTDDVMINETLKRRTSKSLVVLGPNTVSYTHLTLPTICSV